MIERGCIRERQVEQMTALKGEQTKEYRKQRHEERDEEGHPTSKELSEEVLRAAIAGHLPQNRSQKRL